MRIFVHDYAGHPFQIELSRSLAARGHLVEHTYCSSLVTTPHGAVADNLLQQNEPFICLQCHELHFHAGLEGWDEDPVEDTQFYTNPDFANGYYPDGVPNPGGTQSMKMAFTTKCTQCHTMVHGTDSPSQAVPNSGRGLMR